MTEDRLGSCEGDLPSKRKYHNSQAILIGKVDSKSFIIFRRGLRLYEGEIHSRAFGIIIPKTMFHQSFCSKRNLQTSDFVEGIQSNKSIGYSLKIFFTCIQNSLPMKIFPIENFKIAVESSQIAHSIGNFILKNFKTGHFLIK